MTKWAKANWLSAMLLSLAAAGGTQALGQGGPPKAFDSVTAAVRAPGTTVRIDLIGDSTQTNNAGYATLPPEGVKAMKIIEGGPVKIVLVGDSTVNAEGGWGKGFCAVMTPNVTCINEALNGRSSKSFIDEGAWKKALDDHGDYYLIQFGHNDMKGKGPARETDPETTYAANIRRYIRDARAIGAVPVVVTSLSRRNYKDGVLVQDLKDYSAAAKRIGMEENVTVIDLNAMSVKLLEGMTQAQADEFNAIGHQEERAENKKSPVDRTHLNAKGQALFGRMVADTLARTQVELGPDVIGEPLKATTARTQ